MRVWVFWSFIFNSMAFAELPRCSDVLGNPVALFAEVEPLDGLSNRSLLVLRLGAPQKGKNALLNGALDLAAEYGVQVYVVRYEALAENEFFKRAAAHLNTAGAFYTPDGDPVLALGTELSEEFAVHEITHLKDYVAAVKKFEGRGMSREAAMHEARMNNQLLGEHYSWEHRAIINQLKHRYRNNGFDLWDHNLIERLVYPEVDLLLSRHLVLRGEDDGLRADEIMDKAIWKAMIVQRLRYQALLKKGDTAALGQAKALRSALALFNQLFPPTDLTPEQRQLVGGLFGVRFKIAAKRLADLKDNSFAVDAD